MNRSPIKTFPLRTLLLTALFVSIGFVPFAAYSQSYYPQTVPPQARPAHHISAPSMPKDTGEADSSFILLDYYQADSVLYKPNFMGLQGQLINQYYSFPKDTFKSYLAKSKFFMNYDCINSIAVAFDNIVHGNIDSVAQVQIDTLYLPIIQVNHSGLKDTLDIQLTTVDSHGYPNTNTYLTDTLVIDSVGGNDYTVNIIKWNLSHYPVPGSRFAVTVSYYDHSKLDSCWFIYGYGYFKKNCPYEPTDDTIFASTTHFSTITNNTKDFTANSFALWNGYNGLGYLPSEDGNNVFTPCTAADTNSYHPGVDGANYLQDIDIAANVLFISYLGVPNIHSAGISVNQNYPNPYNTTTVINYNLVKPAGVSITVTDLTGRELLSQNYGTMNSGQHSIVLNATNFSSGIYFYSITGSGYTITKKMVVY